MSFSGDSSESHWEDDFSSNETTSSSEESSDSGSSSSNSASRYSKSFESDESCDSGTMASDEDAPRVSQALDDRIKRIAPLSQINSRLPLTVASIRKRAPQGRSSTSSSPFRSRKRRSSTASPPVSPRGRKSFFSLYRQSSSIRFDPSSLPESPPSVLALYKHVFSSFFTKKSTTLLLISILIWFYVQITIIIQGPYGGIAPPSALTEEEIARLKASRTQSSRSILGSAAGEYFSRGKKNGSKGAVSKDGYAKKDRLPKGCVENHWHSFNFPTCNDIHEIIPLGGALGDRKRKLHIPADLGEGDKSADKWSKADKEESLKLGFVGSGLWRQVWKVQARGDHVDDLIDEEYAVLKIMKMEHPVDPRNFDRHRRDSLVMERLTASPYVVGIYGFCGNTVLTEFAGKTLEDYLYDDDENIVLYSKETEKGKVRLALDVMKGLEALHTIPGGPIVHADIQAKQYLFDPKKGVRVNDFNRCRFLPENEKTGKSCQVKIPSAPGLNRSPEEYEKYKVDEKIDIYSSANILYRILSGKKPWMGLLRKEQQTNIMKGIKPSIDEEFMVPGTIEAELAAIVSHAYEYDPKERWNSSQIVERLERLLSKNDGNENSLRGNMK